MDWKCLPTQYSEHKLATLEEDTGMSATATYAQEIEAIETILTKANVLLREFEDREKNVQRHVCAAHVSYLFISVAFC